MYVSYIKIKNFKECKIYVYIFELRKILEIILQNKIKKVLIHTFLFLMKINSAV